MESQQVGPKKIRLEDLQDGLIVIYGENETFFIDGHKLENFILQQFIEIKRKQIVQQFVEMKCKQLAASLN